MAYKISIQAARINAGVSQEQLAVSMGVSSQTVRRWERENNIPKLADFKKFCEVCQVPEDVIFLG